MYFSTVLFAVMFVLCACTAANQHPPEHSALDSVNDIDTDEQMLKFLRGHDHHLLTQERALPSKDEKNLIGDNFAAEFDEASAPKPPPKPKPHPYWPTIEPSTEPSAEPTAVPTRFYSQGNHEFGKVDGRQSAVKSKSFPTLEPSAEPTAKPSGLSANSFAEFTQW